MSLTNCVDSSYGGKREGLPLVAWENICKEKQDGGLGIHDLRTQNDAFAMKLAWRIFSKDASAWVKLMREKYLSSSPSWMPIAKPSDSWLWRNICRVWHHMLKGVRWSLRDGATCRFWLDIWHDLPHPLIYFVTDSVSQNMIDWTVQKFYDDHRGWNASVLFGLVPDFIVHYVTNLPSPVREAGPDVPY